MNAAAIAMLKAAADKKKANWKDPVVKEHKITKEQYLQEKAEEEAKKKNRKAGLRVATAPDDDGASNAILVQVQRERNLFTQEKMSLLQQMQAMKNAMSQQMQELDSNQGKSNSAVFDDSRLVEVTDRMQKELDSARTQIARLESENTALREKVNQSLESISRLEAKFDRSCSTAAASKPDAVARDQVARLEQHVTDLEKEQSNMRQKLAGGESTSSPSRQQLCEKIALLEKKLSSLEKSVKKSCARSKTPANKRSKGSSSSSGPDVIAEVPAAPPISNPLPPPPPLTATSTDSSEPIAPVSPATTQKKLVSPTTPKTKTPKKKKSGNSPSTSKSSPVPTGPINPALAPHATSSLAKAQARDTKLMEFLEKPGGSGAMYPKFSMSIKEIDGHKIVHFYKKVYIPANLCNKTLRYYRDMHGDEWTRVLAKNVIWPSLDADVTAFKHKR